MSHLDASVKELEKASFQDISKKILELEDRDSIKEVAILQTCNRIEIYVVLEEYTAGEIIDEIAEEELGYSNSSKKLKLFEGEEAIKHLLRLSAGLESMIQGEDEILGQIKECFEKALENGSTGKILNKSFEKSIRVGKRVREETDINKGPRSIGSAAVKMCKKTQGSIDDLNFMLIGAGEVAELVCKSLEKRSYSDIYIVDKKNKRSKKLSEQFGGNPGLFLRVRKLL